jgi:hypothetical protein
MRRRYSQRMHTSSGLIVLNQTTPKVAGGWSKDQGVTGSVIPIILCTGHHLHQRLSLGQIIPFSVGTRLGSGSLYHPACPWATQLLRPVPKFAAGTVWFDDIPW